MPRKREDRTEDRNPRGPALPPADMGGAVPETTGRFIVVFKDQAAGNARAALAALNDVAGLREVATSEDYEESAVSADDLAEGNVHFTRLGIAVVSGEEAMQTLSASVSDADSPILAIEPEYIAHLSQASLMTPQEYHRGYRDAVAHLYVQLYGDADGEGEEEAGVSAAAFRDNAQFTWGLQATGVSTSRQTGQGIRVAVLDTGLDFQHRDFRGRAIPSKSFVAGVTPQDVHGHGTHCCGTACGPQRPASGVRRYGVAFGAHLHVGKVFNNAPRPSAPTGSVIAGIEWALASGCRVASLSLGAAIDQKIMQYEVPIQRALNAGLLVVAAAGNNASRPANPGFVEPPANADAAMAVGAVDNNLRIAGFSARSSRVTGSGGIVNVAAPGVAVFSSVPGGHDFFNGTSMATPHVAGIAALWAQATGLSGAALWSRLLQSARPLSLPSVDVGSGLAQAPR